MKAAACSSCGTRYSATSVDSSASDVRVRCDNCGNVFDIQGPADDNTPRTPRGQWYYAADGESFGPYTEGELVEKYQANELDEDTYVWTKGFDEWISAKEHGAFATALAFAAHQKHQADGSAGHIPRRGNYDTPVEALDALPEDPLYQTEETIEYTTDQASSLNDSADLMFDEDMFDDATAESERTHTSESSENKPAETSDASDEKSVGASDPAKKVDATAADLPAQPRPNKKNATQAPKRRGSQQKNKKKASAKPHPLPPPLTPERALRSKTAPKPRRKTAVMAALPATSRSPAPPPKPAAPPSPASSSTPTGASGDPDATLSLAERLRQLRDKPASASTASTPSKPAKDGAATRRLPPKAKPPKGRTVRMVALNTPAPVEAAPDAVEQTPESKPARPKKSQTVRMVALNADPEKASPADAVKEAASAAKDTTKPTKTTSLSPDRSDRKPAKAKKGGTIMLGGITTPPNKAEQSSRKAEPLAEKTTEVKSPAEKDSPQTPSEKKQPAKAKKGGTIMLGGLPAASELQAKSAKDKSSDKTPKTKDTPPRTDTTRTDGKPAPTPAVASSESAPISAAKGASPASKQDAAPDSTAAAPASQTSTVQKDDTSSRRGIGVLLLVLLLCVVAFLGWRLLFADNSTQPLTTDTASNEEDTATALLSEAHAQAQGIFFEAGDAAESAAHEAGTRILHQRVEARDQASEAVVASLQTAESSAQDAAEKAAAEAEAARRRAVAPRQSETPKPATPAPLDNRARSNKARVPNAPPRPRRQNQNAPARRSNTNN